MRPDRIIVGEVRGGETLDMLQAMSTGHDGSLATVHANSAEDALMRLQTLASMSEVEIPFEALQDQINSAVDVIVQLTRHADGSRRIAEIAILASHGRETFRIATVCRFDAQPMAADGTGARHVRALPAAPPRRRPALHGGRAHAAGLRRRRRRDDQLATREAADETRHASSPSADHGRWTPMDTRPLALGVTLLACALAVAGVHTYAAGRAQRQALIDRLVRRPARAREPPAGRRRRFSGRGPAAARAPRLGRRIQLQAGRHRTRPHPRRVLRLHARPWSPGCG